MNTQMQPGRVALDRAKGCLLGQVIGDSLGSLVEFKTAREISRAYPEGVRDLAAGGVWGTLPGQPTDDSELALTLARTLLKHRSYDADRVAGAYGDWLASKPFDIGRTTARAFSAALSAGQDKSAAARQAADRDSQANGSLMRISPIGIWARWPKVAAHYAGVDSELSHPHPVCRVACASLAAAIAEGIRGGDRRAMAFTAMDHVVQGGADPLIDAFAQAFDRRLPLDVDGHQQGWVVTAFHLAAYHLVRGTPFEEALIHTVGLGGDTDTNGAIVGALIGAAEGMSAIPERWIKPVLSCRAEAASGAMRPRPQEYWPVDVLELAEQLLTAMPDFIEPFGEDESSNNASTDDESLPLGERILRF